MRPVDKSKIKDFSELPTIILAHKALGKTIGLVTGCFDIIHIGHLNLFHKAKQAVDILVVGLENDKSIKLSKGPNRPINNQRNRLVFLSALIDVDYVFLIKDIYSFTENKKTRRYPLEDN